MTTRHPFAALALVALIGAGCSSSPAERGGETATQQSKAVQFSACMREHGVGAFPDPDASGELTIDGVVNGSSIDTNGSAWKTAIAACKDLQPPGFTGRRRSAGQQAEALEFAECIRDNGVEDFPDPVNGEPLVNTNTIPSAATSDGMTILNAAMQTCREFVRDALEGR